MLPIRQKNSRTLTSLVVHQQGVALVTAMLVVALATILAVSLITQGYLDLRRSTNLIHSDRAWLYALGAETWAKEVLRKDQEDNKTDYLGENWAMLLPAIAVDGGELSGKLEDLQGRFNLNNLWQDNKVQTWAVQGLQRLFKELNLDPVLVFHIVDWIDPDQDPQAEGGAEDGDYLGHDPPYRAANRPMVSLSELNLIAGFTPTMVKVLTPYLTVLPEPTPLNVNTALSLTFFVLSPALDLSGVETLVEKRGEKGYAATSDFMSAFNGVTQGKEGVKAPDGKSIAVNSHYFLLDAQTHFGQGYIELLSILRRSEMGEVEVVYHAGKAI